jgi:enoyl-CoA hydratase
MLNPLEPLVRVEQVDHSLEITLNRPDKRNAINADMAETLDEALNELDDNPRLRVGLLAATGKAFSAGSDVNAIGDYLTVRGGEYGLLRRRRRKPLIAVIEAPAIGGGMEIAFACDLIVASGTASFLMPEVTRGLVPGMGVFAGPRALPLNVARELELTGVPIDARRAYDLGFVNRLTKPGEAMSVARQLATQIAGNAPTSVSSTLLATNDFMAKDEALGWAMAERARVAIAGSEDAAEGVAAFLEKRAPRWSGR